MILPFTLALLTTLPNWIAQEVKPAAVQATAVQAAADRVVVAGTVHHRDGTKWVGAQVDFTAQIAWWLPELGRTDKLSVTSDDDGKFRTSLLRGRRYIARATQRGDGDTYRYSKFEIFHPVRFHRLRLVETPTVGSEQLVKHVRIQGLEAWRDSGLRYLIGEQVLAPPDPEGRLALPALARKFVWIRAVDKTGRLAGRALIYLRRPPPKDGNVLELEKPNAVLIQVVDADGPIVGAEVFSLGSNSGFRNQTDKNGFVLYPHIAAFGANNKKRNVNRTVHLFVRAKGHADLLHDVSFVSGAAMRGMQTVLIPGGRSPRVLLEEAKPDLVLTLQRGSVLTGKVLWSAGTPAAGIRLLAVSPIQRQGRWLSMPAPTPPRRFAVCDKTGAFRIEALLPGSSYTLWAELEDKPGHIVDPELNCPLGIVAVGTAGKDGPQLGAAQPGAIDLGAIQLDKLRTSIPVTLPDGSPASGVRLWIDVDPRGSIGELRHIPLFANQRGVAHLILAREAKVFLAAAHPHAFGYHETQASPKIAFTLERAIQIQGKFLDKQDNPIAGASVTAGVLSPLNAQPGAPLPPRLRMLFSCAGIYNAMSDKAGKFTIMVPPDSRYRISATTYGVGVPKPSQPLDPLIVEQDAIPEVILKER